MEGAPGDGLAGGAPLPNLGDRLGGGRGWRSDDRLYQDEVCNNRSIQACVHPAPYIGGTYAAVDLPHVRVHGPIGHAGGRRGDAADVGVDAHLGRGLSAEAEMCAVHAVKR